MTSRFDHADDSAGFLFWQASVLWRRKVENTLRPFDLTHIQFVLLASIGYLTKHTPWITQNELAIHTHCDVTMTSQVLRLLEKKGHIFRFTKPGDERAKHPKLTPKGTQLLKKVLPEVEKTDALFFGKLEKDQKNFIHMLKQLRKV